MRKLLLMLVVSFLPVSGLHASLVYFENFENGLSDWTGKNEGAHTGAIVADPKQGDKALTFTDITSRGDVFTTTAASNFAVGAYRLEFDYLGLFVDGQVVDDFGGFIGISDDFVNVDRSDHRWLLGTALEGGAEGGNLIDDDNWHIYSVNFTAVYDFHLILEDFQWSGGIAGDVFFDNIKLYSVPEPTMLMLLAIGGIGMSVVRRKNGLTFSRKHTTATF
jgi:hypothetical protein